MSFIYTFTYTIAIFDPPYIRYKEVYIISRYKYAMYMLKDIDFIKIIMPKKTTTMLGVAFIYEYIDLTFNTLMSVAHTVRSAPVKLKYSVDKGNIVHHQVSIDLSYLLEPIDQLLPVHEDK